MGHLVAILLSSLFLNFANAATSISGRFEVGAYSICNGRPVPNGDLSSCANFSYWNGVRLMELSSIELLIVGNEKLIRLTDKDGHSWSADLNKCDKAAHAPIGCGHEITSGTSAEILIKVNQWDNRTSERLRIGILDEAKVTVSGKSGDHFQFEIRKVGPFEKSNAWEVFRGSCMPNHCYSMMGCGGSRWPSSFKSSCDASSESYCNYRGECEKL